MVDQRVLLRQLRLIQKLRCARAHGAGCSFVDRILGWRLYCRFYHIVVRWVLRRCSYLTLRVSMQNAVNDRGVPRIWPDKIISIQTA